jgi:hypothetical protein
MNFDKRMGSTSYHLEHIIPRKEGNRMDRFILLLVAGILSGFALLKVPLAGTFLASVSPVTDIIGVLAILIFSLFLIYKGIMSILGK